MTTVTFPWLKELALLLASKGLQPPRITTSFTIDTKADLQFNNNYNHAYLIEIQESAQSDWTRYNCRSSISDCLKNLFLTYAEEFYPERKQDRYIIEGRINPIFEMFLLSKENCPDNDQDQETTVDEELTSQKINVDVHNTYCKRFFDKKIPYLANPKITQEQRDKYCLAIELYRSTADYYRETHKRLVQAYLVDGQRDIDEIPEMEVLNYLSLYLVSKGLEIQKMIEEYDKLRGGDKIEIVINSNGQKRTVILETDRPVKSEHINEIKQILKKI